MARRTANEMSGPVSGGAAGNESATPRSGIQNNQEAYGKPPASAELKGARLSLQLSVEEAEKQVQIRADYIRAIESADIDSFPGEPYDLGYVRSYAKFLDTERFFGKPPEWYVEEYRQMIGGDRREADVEAPQTSPSQPAKPVSQGRRLWPVAVAVVVVAALCYGFVQVQYLDVADPGLAAGI